MMVAGGGATIWYGIVQVPVLYESVDIIVPVVIILVQYCGHQTRHVIFMTSPGGAPRITLIFSFPLLYNTGTIPYHTICHTSIQQRRGHAVVKRERQSPFLASTYQPPPSFLRLTEVHGFIRENAEHGTLELSQDPAHGHCNTL